MHNTILHYSQVYKDSPLIKSIIPDVNQVNLIIPNNNIWTQPHGETGCTSLKNNFQAAKCRPRIYSSHKGHSCILGRPLTAQRLIFPNGKGENLQMKMSELRHLGQRACHVAYHYGDQNLKFICFFKMLCPLVTMNSDILLRPGIISYLSLPL